MLFRFAFCWAKSRARSLVSVIHTFVAGKTFFIMIPRKPQPQPRSRMVVFSLITACSARRRDARSIVQNEKTPDGVINVKLWLRAVELIVFVFSSDVGFSVK